MSQHSNQRDHVLRRSLEEALSKMRDGQDVEQIVTEMLRTLDQERMIHYAPAGTLNLLSTHGRVLVAIMEDPAITQRALSVYLGVSESNIQKSLKALTEKGIIAKTKVNGCNTYQLNLSDGLRHPDISRFYDAINAEIARSQRTQRQVDDSDEELPF